MGRTKDGDDGSLSVSKFQLDNLLDIPLHSMHCFGLQHILTTEMPGGRLDVDPKSAIIAFKDTPDTTLAGGYTRQSKSLTLHAGLFVHLYFARTARPSKTSNRLHVRPTRKYLSIFEHI
jgi:hypothetical protein